MTNKHEVQLFLNQFKDKMNIWDILFRNDRGKNADTLAELEITFTDVRKILQKLEFEDYSEGPLEDKLHQIADMWVFGKQVKNREVYIKISMGRFGSSTICISFHFSEKSMKYPFK